MYRVGGVIGETTFKFFLQFIGWTAIYCMFTFVVTAIVISEQKKHVSGCYLFSCPNFKTFLGYVSRSNGSTIQNLDLVCSVKDALFHSKVYFNILVASKADMFVSRARL